MHKIDIDVIKLMDKAIEEIPKRGYPMLKISLSKKIWWELQKIIENSIFINLDININSSYGIEDYKGIEVTVNNDFKSHIIAYGSKTIHDQCFTLEDLKPYSK